MAVSPTGGIIARVAPENRHRLATPLSDAVVASLRGVMNAGLLKPVIPPEHEQELIAAGYGRQALGGFVLTDVGQVRAMMENGQ